MRSKSCYAALLVLLFQSCHPHGAGDGPGVSDSLAARVMGTYNGHFKEGLITLVINYISDSVVSGFDVHKDVRRNVNGTVMQKGNMLEFSLKEPGNKALDGTFYLTMDTLSRAIAGKWIPGDSTKVHTGALDLRRWDKDTSADEPAETWYSEESGSIRFNTELGTCLLAYTRGSDTSATAIRGNYWQTKDTFYIDLEPNKLLPSRQLELIRYPYKEGDDSPPSLRGKGMKFIENVAG